MVDVTSWLLVALGVFIGPYLLAGGAYLVVRWITRAGRRAPDWQRPLELTYSDLEWLTHQHLIVELSLPNALIPEDGGWFPGWNCHPDEPPSEYYAA